MRIRILLFGIVKTIGRLPAAVVREMPAVAWLVIIFIGVVWFVAMLWTPPQDALSTPTATPVPTVTKATKTPYATLHAPIVIDMTHTPQPTPTPVVKSVNVLVAIFDHMRDRIEFARFAFAPARSPVDDDGRVDRK